MIYEYPKRMKKKSVLDGKVLIVWSDIVKDYIEISESPERGKSEYVRFTTEEIRQIKTKYDAEKLYRIKKIFGGQIIRVKSDNIDESMLNITLNELEAAELYKFLCRQNIPLLQHIKHQIDEILKINIGDDFNGKKDVKAS